jgi:hypothetical protein
VASRIPLYTRQHETHRELIGRPRPGAWWSAGVAPDAIVIPASRPAENLEHAARLAQQAGARLVVLCSLEARGAEVAKMLAANGFAPAVIVDVSPGYRHPLLDFETSELMPDVLPRGCVNPNGDLSTKRNLGLLLARLAGWKRIFFMDDDIRDLAPADLLATVSMLDRWRVAGMRVESFPDNSVVCHARREVGDEQDVFVTGSVLAVDCAQPFSFFPEVYNEDWFFFYDEVRHRRVGCSHRNAGQLRYDPFLNSRRARQQEFGDVLAEGLLTLLHKGQGPEGATSAYWTNFIAVRRKLIDDLKGRAAKLEPPLRGKVVTALESATACLMKIQPGACARYVKTWRYDLEAWHERLAALPVLGSIDAALRELGLEQVTAVAADRSTAPDPRSPAAGGSGLTRGAGRGVIRTLPTAALNQLQSMGVRQIMRDSLRRGMEVRRRA